MHDHSKRGPRFCPLMKEFCLQGWTKSMGEDAKTGERPVCAAWQPVTTFNIKTGQNEEVHDCSVYGWVPDLLVEIAQEVSHGAASTDKVANQVLLSRSEFIGALPREALDRLGDRNVNMLKEGSEDQPTKP